MRARQKSTNSQRAYLPKAHPPPFPCSHDCLLSQSGIVQGDTFTSTAERIGDNSNSQVNYCDRRGPARPASRPGPRPCLRTKKYKSTCVIFIKKSQPACPPKVNKESTCVPTKPSHALVCETNVRQKSTSMPAESEHMVNLRTHQTPPLPPPRARLFAEPVRDYTG